MYNHRNASATLEVRVFTSAKRTVRTMRAQFLDSFVLVAIVQDSAVIAREDKQRIVKHTALVKCLYDSADAPVQFSDHVTARTHGGGIEEPMMGRPRHVDIVRCEVQEERAAGVSIDERNRAAGEGVGHGLIVPNRRFAAAHISDAA